jgi:MFS transporter, DHA1 family, multidrug resistance protein
MFPALRAGVESLHRIFSTRARAGGCGAGWSTVTAVSGSRRITVAVGVLMFVDASLYLAVLPLLPDYAHRFDLGTVGAAVVVAAYPVSVPAVSIGCIALVPRLGARRITLASAALMTVSTVIFAWAPSATVLVLARFVQGLASGSVWTASMAWVTENAPPGHRGRESGIVTGMLSAGSIAGPGIGALAGWVGSGAAFGLVALASLAGVLLTYLAPAGRDAIADRHVWDGLVRSARQPATGAALAIAVVDLLAFGSVDLLVPLRLGALGHSVAEIGVALAIGALLGAGVGAPAGRLVDRIGAPVVGSAAAACIVVIPVVLALDPSAAVQFGVLVVGGPLFAVVGAAMFPLSSAGADAAGVSHVTATGLMGAVWAAGFTISPLMVGTLAQSASGQAAYVAVALLCLPAFLVLRRCVRMIPPLARV